MDISWRDVTLKKCVVEAQIAQYGSGSRSSLNLYSKQTSKTSKQSTTSTHSTSSTPNLKWRPRGVQEVACHRQWYAIYYSLLRSIVSLNFALVGKKPKFLSRCSILHIYRVYSGRKKCMCISQDEMVYLSRHNELKVHWPSCILHFTSGRRKLRPFLQ